MKTPYDSLEYVYSNNLTDAFLLSLAKCKGQYSIGEIPDKVFKEHSGKVRFLSKSANINVAVDDDDVVTAVLNKLYVSAFISRNQDKYQIHFLVHKYPEAMKPNFEEEILQEVIRYMILHTIVALRLDTEEKIQKYCS